MSRIDFLLLEQKHLEDMVNEKAIPHELFDQAIEEIDEELRSLGYYKKKEEEEIVLDHSEDVPF